MLLDAGDTRIFCEPVGQGHPVIVLHGGPGLDHGYFRPWLDSFGDGLRLIIVDQRGHGRSDPVEDTDFLSVETFARDVRAIAQALPLERYAVMGHSFGAFVALQHEVDFPGQASHHIIMAGMPSLRFLDAVEQNLASFEPAELREQVVRSWARESEVQTVGDLREILRDQLPFHFHKLGAPYEKMLAGTDGLIGAPAILRSFAGRGYGPFD